MSVDPKVFMSAKQILKDKGWCQGMSEDEFGHVCLGRAINLANVDESPSNAYEFAELTSLIRYGQMITTLNDSQETDLNRVMHFLDECYEAAL